MNRIDRLTAILIHLQSKKVVTAEEIASRFVISKRTVYRDIRALEEAGVPIGAEAGKGYFIIDGYHLPPVMFTRDEAGALLVAEKLVEKLTDKSICEHYGAALFKIKSVLHDREKDYLDRIHRHVEVFSFAANPREEFPDHFFADILGALAQKKVINVDYLSLSKNELVRNRTIEPLGICYYSMHWHLFAWCRLRKDFRDFRIDRIKGLQQLNEEVQRDYPEDLFRFFVDLYKQQDLIPVVVDFHKSLLPFIQQTRYYHGYIEEKPLGDYTQMHFLTHSLDYISSWLITSRNLIRIVQPEDLQKIVVEKVKELQEHYL